MHHSKPTTILMRPVHAQPAQAFAQPKSPAAAKET